MTLTPLRQSEWSETGGPSVASGLRALLLLATLVALPPIALVSFVGNPIPAQAVVGGRITDAAVIGMLAAVVWVAWAQLALAVLVEAIAAARGGGLSRRIPLCGPHQHLARRLVVAVAFLLAGSATMTGPVGAAAAAVAVSAPTCPPAAPDSKGVVSRSTVPNLHPIGAGIDGPRSAATPGSRIAPAVPAGPVDAIAGADAPDAVAEAGPVYVVRPPRGHHHDTLWDIAERHLGDGMRWKEIYELNRDRLQPDGSRLEAPRLIRPGWRLIMPPDAVRLGDAADSRALPMQGRGVPAARETGADPDSVGAPPPVTTPVRTTATPSTRLTTPAASDVAGELMPAMKHATDADDEQSIPFGALTLGLGALAAAGLTAELARRRRRAQRFRPPGSRLGVPDEHGLSAERQLRAANAEITVVLLRVVLRRLAAACQEAGRALPDLQAVLLNTSSITLVLGQDEPAIGPFVAAGPRSWILDSALSEAERPMDYDPDPVDPYPALVSVGVSCDAVVLVNLEAAGTLHIEGPEPAASQILHAITAELGTSDLASSADLVLVGCPPQLGEITDSARTRQLLPDAAARWSRARTRDVSDVLNAAGIRDVLAARTRGLAPDVWSPAVLVMGRAVAPEQPDGGGPVASPYSGLCVLGIGRPSTEGDWVLRAGDGSWHLQPLGIEIQPQRLSEGTLATVDGLLDVLVQPPTGDPRPQGSGCPAATGLAIVTMRPTAVPGPTDLSAIAAAIPVLPPKPDPDADRLADVRTVPQPRVLVLGSVEVTGTADEGTPSRRRRTTELIAYLAVHPGASQHQLDEAMWPGQRVSRNTRNPMVSRARQWLGIAEDGRPYLAHVAEGGEYALRPAVGCDWHDFCKLSRKGLDGGLDGVDDLVGALDLVRGRPFLGVNPTAYAWAEGDIQDMIAAIVDVAHVLADISLAQGDHRRARWAVAKGLAAEPFAEILYRDGIRAANAAGDEGDARRLVASLRRQIEDLDPDDDLSEDTARLLL